MCTFLSAAVVVHLQPPSAPTLETLNFSLTIYMCSMPNTSYQPFLLQHGGSTTPHTQIDMCRCVFGRAQRMCTVGYTLCTNVYICQIKYRTHNILFIGKQQWNNVIYIIWVTISYPLSIVKLSNCTVCLVSTSKSLKLIQSCYKIISFIPALI